MEYRHKCKNGNYVIKVFENNYRVRETKDDFYKPEFPEIYNIVISSYNPYGYVEYADITKYEFIKEILLFSEINIYGLKLFNHPQLDELLGLLNKKNCYIKIHIHQEFLIKNKNINEVHIEVYKIDTTLIKALTDKDYMFCEVMSHNFTFKQLCKIKEFNIILKTCVNDTSTFDKKSLRNKKDINKNLEYILQNFGYVEFDNFSIKQFNLKDKVPELKNNFSYSCDLLFSMVFDLSNNYYYKSFNSKIKHIINNDLKEMFNTIKES
jgi:hypothetical protein